MTHLEIEMGDVLAVHVSDSFQYLSYEGGTFGFGEILSLRNVVEQLATGHPDQEEERVQIMIG